MRKQTEKCYGFLHVHVYGSWEVGSGSGFIGVDFAGRRYTLATTSQPSGIACPTNHSLESCRTKSDEHGANERNRSATRHRRADVKRDCI